MDVDLSTLLAKALPAPKSLHTPNGCDALVLALHCLMVEDGYVSLAADGRQQHGSAPHPDWRLVKDEWVFVYTRPGAARPFRLHCSLQAATGRLFVHASESGADAAPVPTNIQIMGLQLANYASAARCDADSWEGVIQNERTLMEMFSQNVLAPLWEHAEKEPAETILPALALVTVATAAAAALPSAATVRSALRSPTVIGAAVVGLAAVTAAAFIWSRRSAPAASSA